MASHGSRALGVAIFNTDLWSDAIGLLDVSMRETGGDHCHKIKRKPQRTCCAYERALLGRADPSHNRYRPDVGNVPSFARPSDRGGMMDDSVQESGCQCQVTVILR
jgi:hypothetical protein